MTLEKLTNKLTRKFNQKAGFLQKLFTHSNKKLFSIETTKQFDRLYFELFEKNFGISSLSL